MTISRSIKCKITEVIACSNMINAKQLFECLLAVVCSGPATRARLVKCLNNQGTAVGSIINIIIVIVLFSSLLGQKFISGTMLTEATYWKRQKLDRQSIKIQNNHRSIDITVLMLITEEFFFYNTVLVPSKFWLSEFATGKSFCTSYHLCISLQKMFH